jgi:chemotaxis protein MotB
VFEQNSARIDPNAEPILAGIAQRLRVDPGIAAVILEGHASAEGAAPRNWTLSEARASAVFRALVEAGVSPRRLSVRGLGEVAPAEPRDPSEVRPEDRRVEVCVARQLDPLEDVPDWDRSAPPLPWREIEEEP